MNKALEDLVGWCVHHRVGFEVDKDGSVWIDGARTTVDELAARVRTQAAPSMVMPAAVVRDVPQRSQGAAFAVPGYECLAEVLAAAFNQAARGKGKERHAQGEPFQDQVMQQGAQRFGTGALLFQAFKKSEESQRLPHDRAEAELLGAIVYLAGAVIAERRRHAERNQAANDATSTGAARA